MSYSFSKTWQSPEAAGREQYAIQITNLKRLFPKSPIANVQFKDWVEHRVQVVTASSAQIQREATARQERKMVDDELKRRHVRCFKPLNGKEFEDTLSNGTVVKSNRSAVLGMPTIWCPEPHAPWMRFTAPWPGQQELKWEGDDRMSSDAGRFPPLPREWRNSTVAWHHCPMVQPLELDTVRRVPDMEDLIAPVDEIPEEDAHKFISGELWAELN